MSNQFHKKLVLDDLHTIHAREYADTAARDADTDFQVAENLNRIVLVDSPISLWVLAAIGPTIWLELTNISTPGGGDVSGPASSVDNTVARFDGITGKVIQDASGVVITDAGDLGVGIPAPTEKVDVDGNVRIHGGLASVTASVTTEIFSIDDFPAPVSGVITLTSGLYILKEDIITANRFEIAPLGIVTLTSDDRRNTRFEYTGTDTMLTSVGAASFNLENIRFNLSGNAAQFLDITGGTFRLQTGRVTFLDLATVLGTITDCDIVVLRDLVVLSFASGFQIIRPEVIATFEISFQSIGSGTGPLLAIRESVGSFGLIDATVITPGASESIFQIDPSIRHVVNISNTVNLGPGTFFQQPTASGAITATADAGSNVAVAVTSVADNGSGEARFTGAPMDPLFVGQTITHSGFVTHPSYNGENLIVTAVPSATEWEARKIFLGTDTGLMASDAVTVTSVGHGLSELDQVRVFDTIDYDNGYQIFNVMTDTYEISAVFTTSQTGNWDNGSLDQTSKFVDLLSNGAQADSRNFAFGRMNGNAVPTTIAAVDTYQAMDVSTVEENAATELWNLIDAAEGIFRYEGLAPFTGTLRATMTAIKAGQTRIYRFTASIDGAVPVFATAPYAPIEIKATQTQTTLLDQVSLLPGQTVQVFVAGDGTDDDLTVTDFAIEIGA